MKLVCEKTIWGANKLLTLTSTDDIAIAAQALMSTPGIGQPFLMFTSLNGVVITSDFNLHPDWASL